MTYIKITINLHIFMYHNILIFICIFLDRFKKVNIIYV